MKQILFGLFLLLFAAEERTQRKIIYDELFNYEFYVLVEQRENSAKEKPYFWFKGGGIQSTIGGIGGNLLHGDFLKYYKTSQLAEKGEFDTGLKVGQWSRWYETGEIKEITYFRKGLPHGKYNSYDENGEPVNKGRYRSGKKVGQWIENNTDTLSYRNGNLKIKKDPALRNNFFKKLFKKDELKENDPSSKNNFFQKLFKKKEEKEKINPRTDTLREPFFKRLFGTSKKDKKDLPGTKPDKENKRQSSNNTRS